MYKIKKWILRRLFKILKKTPNDMPMVRYWRYSEAIQARVTTNKDGALVMHLEGEDEEFPGFPRAHSLFGSLSPLKHQIKNQIFNESWAKLERGVSEVEVIADIKQKITVGLQEFMDKCRYDMVPLRKMVKPIKELWRVLEKMDQREPKLKLLKEMLCFILQEDDAYRFRVQWLVGIFRPRWWLDPVKLFKLALDELEHAEIVGDMKEKQRLLKRILMLVLKDEKVLGLFKEFCKEVDWSKVKLSRADKYHFRGKWFKVDWLYFEY